MKTINNIFILFTCLVLCLASCKDYLEDEVATPNDPTVVNPALLLASAEVSTFASYAGQLVRQSCTFNQQLAGTDAGSQSIEIANYDLTENTNNNEWEAIYAGAVVDCNLIIDNFGDASPRYAGMAKIIKVLNIGLATDLWGNVPFSEAATAISDGNFNPAYDSQQSILSGINSMLEDAISDLGQSSNEFTPATDDLLYGGDTDAWIKMARVIQARYANRLSQIDPTGSANAALTALNGAFADASEDAMIPFPGGNGTNQWFAFESSRGAYYRVNSTFADMLIADADPRLEFFLTTDGDGGYSGTPADDTSVTGSSWVGDLYAAETASVPLVTYVEQKFIEAEAHMRLGATEDAAMAHNAAVIASVEKVTGAAAPEAFVTSHASETAGSITMEKIMTQKWIALFIQVETYSDWRRTGIPALTPNANALITGIPLRLPTPLEERLYNENAQVVSNVLTPVYWDQ